MTREEKNMLLLRAGLTIKRVALVVPEEIKDSVFEALGNVEEIIGTLADAVETRKTCSFQPISKTLSRCTACYTQVSFADHFKFCPYCGAEREANNEQSGN